MQLYYSKVNNVRTNLAAELSPEAGCQINFEDF